MSRSSTSAGREAFELTFHYFREHRAHMRRILEPFELTPMQMHALRALSPGEPMAMARLADQIFCDPPNVTPVVDKLAARSLVERLTGAQDRRVKQVILTRQGEALRAKILVALSELPPPLAALSVADQRALRDLLRKMVDSIEQPSREA